MYSLANISTAKDDIARNHYFTRQTDESDVAPGEHAYTEVPEIQLAENSRPKTKRDKIEEKRRSQGSGRILKRSKSSKSCHSSQSSTQSGCDSTPKKPKAKKNGDCAIP